MSYHHLEETEYSLLTDLMCAFLAGSLGLFNTCAWLALHNGVFSGPQVFLLCLVGGAVCCMFIAQARQGEH